MKTTEIRKKSRGELLRELTDLREKVRDLRFKVGSGEVKNHQLLRQARKDVARVLTVLHEEEKKA